jgi:hypothetical protein
MRYFSLFSATCPAHPILLNLIILVIPGEEYRSRSSSLCSFLHPPITSPLNLFPQNAAKLLKQLLARQGLSWTELVSWLLSYPLIIHTSFGIT